MGYLKPNGEHVLRPPPDCKMDGVTRLITVQVENRSDTIRYAQVPLGDLAEKPFSPETHSPVRVLVLGWNRRGLKVIEDLDQYVDPNSEVLIVANSAECSTPSPPSQLGGIHIGRREGDSTSLQTLSGLELDNFQHIVVLGYTDRLTRRQADTKTLVTLLHLRHLRKREHAFTIVSEILDAKSRELAEEHHTDDFVVSDNLISLMLTQVSVNPTVREITNELLSSKDSEIYMRRAADYGVAGREVNYAEIIDAGLTREEVVIGYRKPRAKLPEEEPRPRRRKGAPKCASDVVLNPNRSEPLTLDPDDLLVVIAKQHRSRSDRAVTPAQGGDPG